MLIIVSLLLVILDACVTIKRDQQVQKEELPLLERPHIVVNHAEYSHSDNSRFVHQYIWVCGFHLFSMLFQIPINAAINPKTPTNPSSDTANKYTLCTGCIPVKNARFFSFESIFVKLPSPTPYNACPVMTCVLNVFNFCLTTTLSSMKRRGTIYNAPIIIPPVKSIASIVETV